jgi:calcium-independent phospholipase A2
VRPVLASHGPHPYDFDHSCSLFRLQSDHEATTLFSNISYKLEPLLNSSLFFSSREGLQKFLDVLREHPTWTCAHIAAFLGCHECFRHDALKQLADKLDERDQTSPVQLAAESEDLETIQELLIAGANLTLANHEGNNVFHYAAKTKDPTITQVSQDLNVK